jgi:deoxyribose-phosphate aldolase
MAGRVAAARDHHDRPDHALGDDTPGNVRRLCAKARHPLRDDMTEALGVKDLDIKVGAVCVYHALVPTAVQALEGSGIPVAAVSTASPRACRPSSSVSRRSARAWPRGRRRSTS